MTRSERSKSVIDYSNYENSNLLINDTFNSFLQEKLVKTVFGSKLNSISHLKDFESNSSENIDTDVNNEKLKYIQPVESNDIVFQQVDNNILDYAKVEQINETHKHCISKSNELFKNEIEEETLSKNITTKKTKIQEDVKCEISV